MTVLRVLSIFLFCLSTTSCGDKQDREEKIIEGQYTMIARTIDEKIPKNSRVAIKIDSPEKSGLPEKSLKKISTDFSAALVNTSKNKYTIINRNSTEEIWREAVEFAGKDLSKITKTAGANVLISLSPKISDKGLELSVSAYAISEDGMGDIISAATKRISVDPKSEFGIDVNNIDKKIDRIAEIIDQESAAAGNELILFLDRFTTKGGIDINSLARTYKSGCEKPVRATRRIDQVEEEGFLIKCQLYNEGDLLINENMGFEKKVDLFLINGCRACGVNQVIISSEFPNNITIPRQLSKYSKLLGCDPLDSASASTYYFSLSIPQRDRIFLSYSWSGGSGGTWYTLSVFRDPDLLPVRNSAVFQPASPRNCGLGDMAFYSPSRK